jgi:hypothetical protein
MRELLRNRRGSVAFATVIALVPVIGFVALGAEGGSWYVIKQHAQSAADAAAYSGGLQKACLLNPSNCNDNGTTVDYRGKQFAAQNSFCQNGDVTNYGRPCPPIPSGISRTVTVAELTAWKGDTGNFVQATITQQQPAYVAKLLGLSTVTMAATAVAKVATLAHPCVLSLELPLTFQGSTTVQSPNCGLASNSRLSNSIDFTGNGLDVSNAGAISGQGGCAQTGGSQCNDAITYAPPAPNPLSGLDAPMASLSEASFPAQECGTSLTAYDATHQCFNKMGNGKGKTFKFENSTYGMNGVYFFSGDVSIGGSTVLQLSCSPPTCGTILVLLPGSTLSINGGPTIQLTALSSVSATQVPAALASQSVRDLMSQLLIYDPETTTTKPVNISGNSSSYFSGIVYAPNASVQYTGSTVSSTCTQVIAKGVQLSGNSNFDNSGCPAGSKAETKIVKLVP